MERYFKPVHGSSEDDVQTHKHPRHVHHQHHDHYNHYHQHGSHSQSSSSSQGKHSERHNQDRDRPNQTYPYGHPQDEHQSFPKRSSSSLSSSSSSSSASWTSEPSLEDESYLIHKPQHSLSCSNIPEVQWKSSDREPEDFNFQPNETRHHQSLEDSEELLPSSQHGQRMKKLCRGQSKSEEGLQHKHSDGYSRGTHSKQHEPLYKTTSLEQSMAFSAEDILAGRGLPKKAASSIQLPTKGILKNKDEGQKNSNIRKAKSMEVISTRVDFKGMYKRSSMEAARDSFVKGKLQFSAFLDEITRQVISPSALSSFGITKLKSPSDVAKNSIRKPKEESVAVTTKQLFTNTSAGSNIVSRSHKRSNSSKHNRSLSKHSPQHSSKEERHGKICDKPHSRNQQHGPELIHSHLSKHKCHHQSSCDSFRHIYTRLEHKGSPPPLRVPGLSESPSSKSSTSASSEKSDRAKHTGSTRECKGHKDSETSVDRVLWLEQQNRDLHEKLLQTVACIENMEMEVQCNKTELSSFREKYRRLQENYSVSQQGNCVLEQKLNSVVDSLDSDRHFLVQKVTDLTKQLEMAQKTITSLENINVPSLIRGLLQRHLDSQEDLQHLCLQTGRDESDELNTNLELKHISTCGARGGSDANQHLATAFLPWSKHDPWNVLEPLGTTRMESRGSCSSADNVPMYKPSCHQPRQLGANTKSHGVSSPSTDFPSNPYNFGDTRRKTGGVDAVSTHANVSYLTAQRTLDGFMKQIHSPGCDGEDSMETDVNDKEVTEMKK